MSQHPATDTVELTEAKTYLDSLKRSFTATWQGTERTLQFLMQVLQRQTQQIRNLQERANMLERQVQEKTGLINQLETRIVEFESHVNAKDKELVEVRGENGKLKWAISQALSRCREYQGKLEELEVKVQSASAEVACLRVMLAEAEERAAATAERKEGRQTSSGLSDEQVKNMEAALKKELESRSDAVRKAARDAITPLRDGYLASQARVKELEEQLQKLQNSKGAVTHTSRVSSDLNDEGPSSSTPSHIVSGKYRPKPSPAPLGQNLGQNSNGVTGSHPTSVATPSPLPHPAQINSLSSSNIAAREVVDLTNDSPDIVGVDPIVEGAAQGLKRKRADLDNATLLSETGRIQSNAHRPMQGGSQRRDIHR